MTSHWLLAFKRSLFDLSKTLNPSQDKITCYLKLDDPYSYLLLQVLPKFLKLHPKTLEIELLLELPRELNLEIDKQAIYSLQDAKRLAHNYDLIFPAKTSIPSSHRTLLANSILLKNTQHVDFLSLCRQVADALWISEKISSPVKDLTSLESQYGKLQFAKATSQLQQASERLVSNGHYLSAMLHYGGEWYWGIDRLWHLNKRLISNRQQQEQQLPFLETNPLSKFNTTQNIRTVDTTYPIVDFYFSFRSPYSYIAAQRLLTISQSIPQTINIKPVLPMVMRGLQVPKVKKMYILHDAKREAERYRIPFGKISDPLGLGVERCMALFYFAKQQGLEQQFVLSVSRGIWAEGEDVTSDKSLARLVSRAGLDWQQAKPWLDNHQWRQLAEDNRLSLHELGLWGVPSFHSNKLVIWGQDRIAEIL